MLWHRDGKELLVPATRGVVAVPWTPSQIYARGQEYSHTCLCVSLTNPNIIAKKFRKKSDKGSWSGKFQKKAMVVTNTSYSQIFKSFQFQVMCN